MNSPAVPNFQITGNAAVDSAILKAIAVVATAIVAWIMTKLNLNDPELTTYLTVAVVGVLVTLATFVYGFFLSKVNQAKAVQSGINLAASGNAVTEDGQAMTVAAPTTPPKAVTMSTAAEIVKNFATPN